MKVGVLQFFSWPGRKGAIEAVYDRALDRIRTMDQTGYDAVWLAEHHFNSFSVCPSVTMVGVQAAERTERLRIGTAGTLAGLHHPLHLAEQLAFLDVVSGGRLNWGAARGFDATEFQAFGVTGAESTARFRENVKAVVAAWSQDRASFHGDHVRFDDVELLPKPTQRPHPPTWMAVSSPSAIEWAASEGFPILMDPHSSHAEIARKQQLWRDAVTGSGADPDDFDIPVARLLAIAPTDGEAEKIARRGATWMLGSYVGNQSNVTPGGRDRPMDLDESDDPLERYIDRVVIWGSPERVSDELERLGEEVPIRYLMAAPLSGQTFSLLTEKVLPRLSMFSANA